MTQAAIHTRGRALLVTPGEPAGVGPDVLLQAVLGDLPGAVVAIADPGVLAGRAKQLGLDLKIQIVGDAAEFPQAHVRGVLPIWPVSCAAPVIPGQLNPDNAGYVLACLDQALALLRDNRAAALCTGPVHKGVINDAGIAFTGHTEYLAAPFGCQPVMMLAGPSIRVALVTTHLPLAAVPAAITCERVLRSLKILAGDLTTKLGIESPRIVVTGLNPHAGEGGHLGHEDAEQIAPAITQAQALGINAVGPLPADTAFEPGQRAHSDAYLAMYHDQGLAVVKALDFRSVVNVTLGLPIIRTSVDHGTALDLAGSGNADISSLMAALGMGARMAAHLSAAS